MTRSRRTRHRSVKLGDSTEALAARLRSGVVEDSLADVRVVIVAMFLVMTLWTVVPAVGALAFGIWLAARARTHRRSCLSADRAASIPLMPWTPPPGGVDDEQRYRPSPTRYGSSDGQGRKMSWRMSWMPPLMSPPT